MFHTDGKNVNIKSLIQLEGIWVNQPKKNNILYLDDRTKHVSEN